MNESDSRLIIKHKNQTIENCFYETGLFLLEPKVTGVIPAVAGAISNIYKESGDGEHSVYQLHQAAATSGWSSAGRPSATSPTTGSTVTPSARRGRRTSGTCGSSQLATAKRCTTSRTPPPWG